MAEGEAPGYSIKDPGKLHSVAMEYGLALDGKDDLTLAGELADAMQEDYGTRKSSVTLLAGASIAKPRRRCIASTWASTTTGSASYCTPCEMPCRMDGEDP